MTPTAAATASTAGAEMHALIAELYPICRSITGAGTLETLQRLQARIPLEIHSVPSGTQVFDWTVPLEWNIQDAYVADLRGQKLIDFRRHSLHALNYSAPFRGRVAREELLRHIYSLPDQPDLIPYRTSYYQKNWGFCATDRQKQSLRDDFYDVVIDTTLAEGHMHYGELFVPGEEDGEILIATHICHPSLCNDNLSGIAVADFLARTLGAKRSRMGYRFLFLPVTIGAIAWLAGHKAEAHRIKAGVVLACVGDGAPPTYKRSRGGGHLIDRAFAFLLRREGYGSRVRDFWPYGYDERQFGSPGFNLPVGCLMRSVYGEFPEYHTSADDLDFVDPESLEHSAQLCLTAFEIVQNNAKFRNLAPYCEPHLGKRGLYSAEPQAAHENLALLWVLNQSSPDGTEPADLLEIAERSGLPFEDVHAAALRAEQAGLLARCADSALSSARNRDV